MPYKKITKKGKKQGKKKNNQATNQPVVTRADLMAAGDQSRCKDFMSAAIPATWGQDIEVPDSSAYPWMSFEPMGGYAAKISTPGATMSGYHPQSDNGFVR